MSPSNQPATLQAIYAQVKATATPVQTGTNTGAKWMSGQPPGSDLANAATTWGYPPTPMNTIPGSEYNSYSPPVPNNPPPVPNPPALSALGSVAGNQIVIQPVLQGPAIPGHVMTGNVF